MERNNVQAGLAGPSSCMYELTAQERTRQPLFVGGSESEARQPMFIGGSEPTTRKPIFVAGSKSTSRQHRVTGGFESTTKQSTVVRLTESATTQPEPAQLSGLGHTQAEATKTIYSADTFGYLRVPGYPEEHPLYMKVHSSIPQPQYMAAPLQPGTMRLPGSAPATQHISMGATQPYPTSNYYSNLYGGISQQPHFSPIILPGEPHLFRNDISSTPNMMYPWQRHHSTQPPSYLGQVLARLDGPRDSYPDSALMHGQQQLFTNHLASSGMQHRTSSDAKQVLRSHLLSKQDDQPGDIHSPPYVNIYGNSPVAASSTHSNKPSSYSQLYHPNSYTVRSSHTQPATLQMPHNLDNVSSVSSDTTYHQQKYVQSSLQHCSSQSQTPNILAQVHDSVQTMYQQTNLSESKTAINYVSNIPSSGGKSSVPVLNTRNICSTQIQSPQATLGNYEDMSTSLAGNTFIQCYLQRFKNQKTSIDYLQDTDTSTSKDHLQSSVTSTSIDHLAGADKSKLIDISLPGAVTSTIDHLQGAVTSTAQGQAENIASLQGECPMAENGLVGQDTSEARQPNAIQDPAIEHSMSSQSLCGNVSVSSTAATCSQYLFKSTFREYQDENMHHTDTVHKKRIVMSIQKIPGSEIQEKKLNKKHRAWKPSKRQKRFALDDSTSENIGMESDADRCADIETVQGIVRDEKGSDSFHLNDMCHDANVSTEKTVNMENCESAFISGQEAQLPQGSGNLKAGTTDQSPEILCDKKSLSRETPKNNDAQSLIRETVIKGSVEASSVGRKGEMFQDDSVSEQCYERNLSEKSSNIRGLQVQEGSISMRMECNTTNRATDRNLPQYSTENNIDKHEIREELGTGKDSDDYDKRGDLLPIPPDFDDDYSSDDSAQGSMEEMVSTSTALKTSALETSHRSANYDKQMNVLKNDDFMPAITPPLMPVSKAFKIESEIDIPPTSHPANETPVLSFMSEQESISSGDMPLLELADADESQKMQQSTANCASTNFEVEGNDRSTIDLINSEQSKMKTITKTLMSVGLQKGQIDMELNEEVENIINNDGEKDFNNNNSISCSPTGNDLLCLTNEKVETMNRTQPFVTHIKKIAHTSKKEIKTSNDKTNIPENTWENTPAYMSDSDTIEYVPPSPYSNGESALSEDVLHEALRVNANADQKAVESADNDYDEGNPSDGFDVSGKIDSIIQMLEEETKTHMETEAGRKMPYQHEGEDILTAESTCPSIAKITKPGLGGIEEKNIPCSGKVDYPAVSQQQFVSNVQEIEVSRKNIDLPDTTGALQKGDSNSSHDQMHKQKRPVKEIRLKHRPYIMPSYRPARLCDIPPLFKSNWKGGPSTKSRKFDTLSDRFACFTKQIEECPDQMEAEDDWLLSTTTRVTVFNTLHVTVKCHKKSDADVEDHIPLSERRRKLKKESVLCENFATGKGGMIDLQKSAVVVLKRLSVTFDKNGRYNVNGSSNHSTKDKSQISKHGMVCDNIEHDRYDVIDDIKDSEQKIKEKYSMEQGRQESDQEYVKENEIIASLQEEAKEHHRNNIENKQISENSKTSEQNRSSLLGEVHKKENKGKRHREKEGTFDHKDHKRHRSKVKNDTKAANDIKSAKDERVNLLSQVKGKEKPVEKIESKSDFYENLLKQATSKQDEKIKNQVKTNRSAEGKLKNHSVRNNENKGHDHAQSRKLKHFKIPKVKPLDILGKILTDMKYGKNPGEQVVEESSVAPVVEAANKKTQELPPQSQISPQAQEPSQGKPMCTLINRKTIENVSLQRKRKFSSDSVGPVLPDISNSFLNKTDLEPRDMDISPPPLPDSFMGDSDNNLSLSPLQFTDSMLDTMLDLPPCSPPPIPPANILLTPEKDSQSSVSKVTNPHVLNLPLQEKVCPSLVTEIPFSSASILPTAKKHCSSIVSEIPVPPASLLPSSTKPCSPVVSEVPVLLATIPPISTKPCSFVVSEIPVPTASTPPTPAKPRSSNVSERRITPAFPVSEIPLPPGSSLQMLEKRTVPSFGLEPPIPSKSAIPARVKSNVCSSSEPSGLSLPMPFRSLDGNAEMQSNKLMSMAEEGKSGVLTEGQGRLDVTTALATKNLAHDLNDEESLKSDILREKKIESGTLPQNINERKKSSGKEKNLEKLNQSKNKRKSGVKRTKPETAGKFHTRTLLMGKTVPSRYIPHEPLYIKRPITVNGTSEIVPFDPRPAHYAKKTGNKYGLKDGSLSCGWQTVALKVLDFESTSEISGINKAPSKKCASIDKTKLADELSGKSTMKQALDKLLVKPQQGSEKPNRQKFKNILSVNYRSMLHAPGMSSPASEELSVAKLLNDPFDARQEASGLANRALSPTNPHPEDDEMDAEVEMITSRALKQMGTELPLPPEDTDEEMDEGRRCLSAMSVQIEASSPRKPKKTFSPIRHPSPPKISSAVSVASSEGHESEEKLYQEALRTLRENQRDKKKKEKPELIITIDRQSYFEEKEVNSKRGQESQYSPDLSQFSKSTSKESFRRIFGEDASEEEEKDGAESRQVCQVGSSRGVEEIGASQEVSTPEEGELLSMDEVTMMTLGKTTSQAKQLAVKNMKHHSRKHRSRRKSREDPHSQLNYKKESHHHHHHHHHHRSQSFSDKQSLPQETKRYSDSGSHRHHHRCARSPSQQASHHRHHHHHRTSSKVRERSETPSYYDKEYNYYNRKSHTPTAVYEDQVRESPLMFIGQGSDSRASWCESGRSPACRQVDIGWNGAELNWARATATHNREQREYQAYRSRSRSPLNRSKRSRSPSENSRSSFHR